MVRLFTVNYTFNTMKNFLLSLAVIYGIGMSIYGSVWYLKDIKQLELAVQSGNRHIEMRHRINTWGNVGTILFANLISVTALAGLNSRCPSSQCGRKDEN